MTGDSSNAELGVAITDALDAKGKLPKKNGLKKYHDWTIKYLNERIIAIAIIITPFWLMIIWGINLPNLVKYGITIMVVFIVVVFPVIFIRHKETRLYKVRKKQLEKLRSKKT